MQTAKLYRDLAREKPEYLERAEGLEEMARTLKTQVLAHFWVEDERGGYFALGTDRDEKTGNLRPLTIRTSNMGHLLNSDILSGDEQEMKSKRDAIVDALFSTEMWSPNGIRTLGKSSVRFRPGSYHNGSVWPWDNYFIGLGLEKCGYKEEACLTYATIGLVIKRAKRYPEFVRGGEGARPLLNSAAIEVPDILYNRQNKVEQPPQDIQLFTVATAVAIAKLKTKGISSL